MDRENALQNYREAVSGRISEFRSRMGGYLVEHAGELEAMVRTGMELLGKQMEEGNKEYVCFLYFSLLKIDLIQKKYRFLVQGMDMRWYLDEEPAEVYVDATEVFRPFDELWDALLSENRGYGGAVNIYDIHHLLFEELLFVDSVICRILRYRLRDWEKKGIFDRVPRSPYWILKWGEYRDRSEILLQTDRVEKEPGAWKEELKKAVGKPDRMIFGYWYKGTCEEGEPVNLDMRFITFEKSTLKNLAFQNCNMEGSRFPESTLIGCSFEGCSLCGADFRGCSFEKTSFAGAELTEAIFPAESLPFLGISAEQLQVIRIEATSAEADREVCV